jgi:hypothetical protein
VDFNLDQVSDNQFLSVDNNLFDVSLGGVDDLLSVCLDLLGDLLGLSDLNLQFLDQDNILGCSSSDDLSSDDGDTMNNCSDVDNGSVDNNVNSFDNNMNVSD